MASLLVHLALPVPTDGSWRAIAALATTCAVFFVPFAASGVCVALALTRFPAQSGASTPPTSSGAAVGCLAWWRCSRVADGPTAVVAVAALGGARGAAASRAGSPRPGCFRAHSTPRAALATFALATALLVQRAGGDCCAFAGTSPTRGRSSRASAPLLERWNSHSRIRVWGDREVPRAPFGWSLSPTLPDGLRPAAARPRHRRQRLHGADALRRIARAAALPRVRRHEPGAPAAPDADVLVIGAGGGRDVLSALVFGQASVPASRSTPIILDVVHGVFGDFTGHLDRHPKVRFVNDEARSFVARLDERFDIIQISLIDSWAATAAGAFVLTEHALYTVEAWKLFLEHLAPGGILTVTRFYFPENPATAYRLVGARGRGARGAGRRGAARPHRAGAPRPPSRTGRCARLLVGRGSLQRRRSRPAGPPWSRAARLRGPAEPAPGGRRHLRARGRRRRPVAASTPSFRSTSSPPVDDRPFFFHMLRLRDVFAADPGSPGPGRASTCARSPCSARCSRAWRC